MDAVPGDRGGLAQRAHRWLLQLPFDDALQRRHAGTLQAFALVLLGGALLVEGGRLVSGYTGRFPAASLINALTMLIAVLALVWLRRGHYRRGVLLFVLGLSGIYAVAIALQGLAFSRDALKNMAIPLALAALLLGRRALWTMLAGFAAVMAIGLARDQRMLGGAGPRPPPETVFGVFGVSLLVFSILCIVLDRFGLTMREAFSDALARQLELESAARKLAAAHQALGAEMHAREQLQEKLRQAHKIEAIGRLAGGVAHDFNNLLTVIVANVELGKLDLPAVHPLRESLEEISGAARRGAQLTRQLLAFGRRQVIEPRAFDLGAQLQGMTSILRRLIGEEVDLAFELGANLPPVMADQGQVEQVLLNLVVNARDALFPGGRITVRTSVELVAETAEGNARAGSYLVLSVIDDGQGMPPEVLAHLFEPFFTTKPPGRGTGLGLATVYGIARQHGGAVEVESRVGQGSTFRVLLPVAPGGVADPAPAPEPAAAALPRGSETILFAEDEAGVREATRSLLIRLGYRVLSARDGSEALALCGADPGRIDLLLTDVIMPGMNGRELAERVALLRPGIPVVYLSGYAQEVVDGSGILGRGVLLVRKPYLPSELAIALRAALREATGPAAGDTL